MLQTDNQGNLYHGTKKLSENEIQELAEEARTMKELQLYNILREQDRLVAYQIMFENMSDVMDSYFGKAILYTDDMRHKKVDKLSKIR